MAISKQRKAELVERYVERLKGCTGVVLADYRGLSVDEMTVLRRKLRPLDAKLQVVKNTMLKRALDELGLPAPEDWLIGPTAVGFCYSEVPPIAKVFKEAEEDLGRLNIKGGLVGTLVTPAEQMRAIADLPPRDVLLGQVLGSINAPATQLVGVLASGIRQIMNVLQAYVEKLEESGSVSGSQMEQAPGPV